MVDEKQAGGTEKKLESLYGPLAWKLYSNIRSQGLFKITSVSFFMEELIEFYVQNIRIVDKSELASQNLHALVPLLPSLRELRTLLTNVHKYTSRKMALFKLILDIMICYYKATEKPVYKKLRKEVIPLALKFYATIPEAMLVGMVSELISCGCVCGTGCVKTVEEKYVLLKNSKKEVVEYYRTEVVNLENLSGGTDTSMFCM